MGKRSAQARNEVEARGIRDQSRMATTRYEAWGNAREPDGETPDATPSLKPWGKNIARCRCDAWPTCPFARESTPGGQAQRAVFPQRQGRSKKGAKPLGHISPRSAIDRMSLPATIR